MKYAILGFCLLPASTPPLFSKNHIHPRSSHQIGSRTSYLNTTLLLLNLLPLKLRQPLLNIRPSLLTLTHPPNRLQDLLFAPTHLHRAIPLPERIRPLRQTLKVDRDTKRGTHLILPRVPPSDADAGVVDDVVDLGFAEEGGERLDAGEEVRVVGEGEEGDGDGGEGWWEGEHGAGFVAFAGPEDVLAESVEYATETLESGVLVWAA